MRIRRNHCAAAAALLLAIVGHASGSLGQAPPASVAIWYEAPDACPNAGTFLEEIRRRTSRVSVHEAASGLSDLQISISRGKDRFVGSLRRQEPAGTTSNRSLEAVSCEEVASALALVAALALDPDADTSPEPRLAPSASAPPAASDTPPPPPPSASVAPSAPRETPRVRHPTEPTPPHPHERARARAALWVGARGGVDANTVAPGITLIPALSIELRWRGGAAAWGPSLRLSGHLAPREYEGDAGAAKLRWYGARLDGCAFFLRYGSRLEGAPCAGVGTGALHAQGIADRPKESTSLWVDLEASARGRLLLTAWFALELQGGLVVPLTRPTLEFRENDQVLYRVPAVGVRSSLGIAGTIP